MTEEQRDAFFLRFNTIKQAEENGNKDTITMEDKIWIAEVREKLKEII